MAALDQLNTLASLMETIQGTEQKTKTKSSSTQTSQTQVSDAGVSKLINDMLAGPGGVKAIGGAARQTGLFNSTTESMLLGDLFSRAAVSAELARSPTVVNTTSSGSQVTETPGTGLGGIGTMMLAGQAGKALFGKGGEGGLLEGAGDAISGFFGGGAGAATSAVTAGAPAATSALAGATGSAAVNAGVAGTAGGALSTIGAGGSATAAGSSAAGAGAGAASASGFGMNAATAIPLGGSFLGGILGGREASQEPAGLAMSALAGAAALGPIGLIAAPIAMLAGGFLSDLSVVCTALTKKGLISPKLHKAGAEYFFSVDAVTKTGYWAWGVPVAKKIEAGSKFWTLLTLPITESYLKFLAGPRTILSTYDHPLGGMVYYLGEPACKALGKVIIFWETRIKRFS